MVFQGNRNFVSNKRKVKKDENEQTASCFVAWCDILGLNSKRFDLNAGRRCSLCGLETETIQHFLASALYNKRAQTEPF